MEGKKTQNYVNVLTKVADILKLQPTVTIRFQKSCTKSLKDHISEYTAVRMLFALKSGNEIYFNIY